MVRHPRLTVVAGGSVIQGSDDLGRSALNMVDALDAAGDWSFEAVAAALHQLVLGEDPRGVAAALADDDGEVLLFAFDRASAQGGDTTASGDGRSGWKTEVASGSEVQLRLDNVPFKAAETDMELREGLVPGAGALLTVTPFVPQDAPQASPTTSAPVAQTHQSMPPPPSQPSAGAALPPNYLPAPPPTQDNKVPSSLLPPPPGEWQPGPPVTGPGPNPGQSGDHMPPPPAGPATNLAPPASEPPSGPPAMGSS